MNETSRHKGLAIWANSKPLGASSTSAIFYVALFGLNRVMITDSVTTIEFAFVGGALNNIEIPDSVTNIGALAFINCYNLTNATIPGSVTDIGDQAFSFCTNLSSVTLGNGVTRIGFEALFGSGLTRVIATNGMVSASDIPDTDAQWFYRVMWVP